MQRTATGKSGHGPLAQADVADVRDALSRILASPDFDASERNRRFLAYIVEEALAGRGGRVKAYGIALAVFNRDETFDPQTDPIVRIEASRLRRSLERFYLLAGKDDEVRIEIPKGGYVPVFARAGGHTANGEVPPGDGARPLPPTPAPARRRRLAPAAAGLALVVLLAVAAAAMIRGRAEAPGASAPSRPAVMVMPFENFGSPDDHLADGMALEILSNLIHFKELVVFDARVSFSPTDASPLALARRLGADYVVTGTIRRDQERLGVTAQLVRVDDGASIWAEGYDEALSTERLFALQNRIAAAVAATVAEPFGIIFRDAMAQLQREPPRDLSAYECVLRAYAFYRSADPQEHAAARACLERAVLSEPDYADAKAMLALAYLDEFRLGFNARPDLYDARDKALEVAEEAAAEAPDNAAVQTALSDIHYFRGELEEAFLAGERAVAANPNYAEVRAMLGLRLAHSGQWERGITLVREAMAGNPAPPGWYYFPLAGDAIRRGEDEEALAWADKVDMPLFFWTHVFRAAILGRLGRREEAAAAISRLREVYPGFGMGEAETELAKHHMDDPVRQRILEGLRLAGLDAAS
jgi:adenylate cyclase